MPSNSHATTTAALPTLAWIATRAVPAHPRGYDVAVFEDSDGFLLDAKAFDFDFYVVDVLQAGVSGIDLVRLIRRHGAQGIIALDAWPLPSFRAALDSGADMVVAADASPGDFESAIAAVRRRTGPVNAVPGGHWRLSEATLLLSAPSGASVTLSDSDLKILSCFVESAGKPVDRRILTERLWGTGATGMDNALQANIYRLRKRIEAAAPDPSPIRSVARTGYEFRAAIVRG